MRVFGSRFAPGTVRLVAPTEAWWGPDPLEKVAPASDYSSQLHDIIRRRPGTLEAARRKLHDRECTPRHADPPRPDAGRRLEHPAGAVEEHQVEWKPHEGRVNGRARGEDQRFARAKSLAAEQALPPRGRVESGDHRGCDRLAR